MRRLMLFIPVCAWAALTPLRSGTGGGENRAGGGGYVTEAWPARWEGRPLRPLALTPPETRFAGTFPGTMARFTDGSREILFRRVTRPTRKLHPASDCLRASGYTVTPLPAETAGPGRTWSRLAATRKGERLEVRELVVAGDGTAAGTSALEGAGNAETWTDVSAWYWNALWGRSAGPWTAVTISRRL